MSHFKADNLVVLMAFVMAFLCEISKMENVIFFSLTNVTNYSHLYDHQKCEKVDLSKHTFVLLFLAPFGTSSQTFI